MLHSGMLWSHLDDEAYVTQRAGAKRRGYASAYLHPLLRRVIVQRNVTTLWLHYICVGYIDGL